jgi:hypothetical protein
MRAVISLICAAVYFWQIHRTFHFEANGENATTEVDKEAPAGAGGLWGWGFLIFGK